jgi:anaerobic selenocysteine-containing dehydrogenase
LIDVLQLKWYGSKKGEFEMLAKTLCRMCGRYCGLNVTLEGNRMVKVEGMPEHYASKGGICGKGLASAQFEYDPKRLIYPLKRIGERGSGKWERISWGEAYNIISERLHEIRENDGPQALVYHRGRAPDWGPNWSYVQRFMNVWGSPNIATHSHNCHMARAIGHVHTYGGHPIPDYDKTKFMILWGYNPAYTSVVNHARRILDAKQKGAKVVVIDPRFTNMASKADIYLRLRPGTDGTLALGMLRLIIEEELYDKSFVNQWTVGFEKLKEFIKAYPLKKVEDITWVPAEKIAEVARLYATHKPAILEEANGIDQHTNVVQTVRAMAILQAVTGNLDIPGGHLFIPPLPLKDMTLREKAPSKALSLSSHPLYYNLCRISTVEMLDAIETGKPYPVKALIVQGSGLSVISSNSDRVKKTLGKVDFIVVHDLYLTTDAQIADLALPAKTFLEYSLPIFYPFGYGPSADVGMMGIANEIVDAPGECKSDPEFIFEMARRLDLEEYFPWRSSEEAFDEELAPSGFTVKDLQKNPQGIIMNFQPHTLYKKYEKGGFNTPSKKVEIYSETFEQLGYDPLPGYVEPAETPVSAPKVAEEYPLICGTGLKLGLFTHSQFRTLEWLNEIIPEPYVEIHPQAAKELHVKDGGRVKVETLRGDIEVIAKITEATDPRVIFITYGWGHSYAHGASVNVLTDMMKRCPISGANGNRSFLGRIRKA